MTWLKRAFPAVVAVVAACFSIPASAQVTGHPLELSAGAGLFKYDIRARVDLGPAYQGAVGIRIRPWFAIEGTALFGPSKQDSTPFLDHNHSFFGLDLRWNVRPAEDRVVPYVLTGMAYGQSNTLGHGPEKLERGSPSVGFGLLYNVHNPRTYVRLQVRDQMFRERDAKEFSNHFAVTVGVQYALFGKYRDQDLDGVRDWLDKCPNTPIGAKTTADGCPLDADADSVFDGIDQCAATPPGCKVDPKGCPIDSDGDGVCDGVDRCADTPKGATVDATGCSQDADADSVADGIDKCPNTPKGCTVDAEGCTTDTDKDGVCDALDQCPGTPEGTAVGPTGCPTTLGDLERTLLETGMVRLKGVVFGTQKSAIESSPPLDDLARVVQQYPTLRIEIGGPTDVKGKQAEKERLSLEQARAVLDYLKGRSSHINAAQFTLRGYAVPPEGLPPVPEAERRKGRRVEFKVLNQDELDAERAKRNVQKKGP